MPLVRISDPTDSVLADYRNLPEPELVQRRGRFVAEGRLVVRRLLTESGFAVRSVMVTEPARLAIEDALARRPGVPVYVMPQPVMNEVAGFNIHRGCLAIGERPAERGWEDLLSDPKSQNPNPNAIVVLEGIGNADNVGGIFRSAAAFGAGAVLLDPASTDPLYRKAIRTSMGAALVVPFARLSPWPSALAALQDAGFATLALTPDASAPAIRDTLHAIGSGRVALLLGHEGDGLSAAALAACSHQARIPIAASVDSLNVAVAAAIALYECTAAGAGAR